MYDPSSSANINEATVDHFSLDWTIDFCKSRISGSATLSIRIIKPTDKIVIIFLLQYSFLKKIFNSSKIYRSFISLYFKKKRTDILYSVSVGNNLLF